MNARNSDGKTTFEGTLDLRECTESDTERGMTVSRGADSLEQLAKALEAYGMDVSFEVSGNSATIKIDHLQPWDARQARTRNAGRHKKGTFWPSFTGATDEERLVWCESHTIDEIKDTLRCSRRTAQRRLAELRAKVRG